MKPQPTMSDTISMDAPRWPAEQVDQQTDPDHLAVPEGVREPRNAVAAMHHAANSSPTGKFDPERPAGRQHHHQHEDGDQKQAGEIAGIEIEPVENSPDHKPLASGAPAVALTELLPIGQPDRSAPTMHASCQPTRESLRSSTPVPRTGLTSSASRISR